MNPRHADQWSAKHGRFVEDISNNTGEQFVDVDTVVGNFKEYLGKTELLPYEFEYQPTGSRTSYKGSITKDYKIVLPKDSKKSDLLPAEGSVLGEIEYPITYDESTEKTQNYDAFKKRILRTTQWEDLQKKVDVKYVSSSGKTNREHPIIVILRFDKIKEQQFSALQRYETKALGIMVNDSIRTTSIHDSYDIYDARTSIPKLIKDETLRSLLFKGGSIESKDIDKLIQLLPKNIRHKPTIADWIVAGLPKDATIKTIDGKQVKVPGERNHKFEPIGESKDKIKPIKKMLRDDLDKNILTIRPLFDLQDIDRSVSKCTKFKDILIHSKEDGGYLSIECFDHDYEDFDKYKQKRFSPNNPFSSRSHILFSFSIKVKISGETKVVKFCVLDMAGKENVIQFDDIKSRFREHDEKTQNEILEYMRVVQQNEGMCDMTQDDSWLSCMHNYMMLVSEGRFVNETLDGLLEEVRNHNLRRKIFGLDPENVRYDFNNTNSDDELIRRIKEKNILLQPMTFIDDYQHDPVIRNRGEKNKKQFTTMEGEEITNPNNVVHFEETSQFLKSFATTKVNCTEAQLRDIFKNETLPDTAEALSIHSIYTNQDIFDANKVMRDRYADGCLPRFEGMKNGLGMIVNHRKKLVTAIIENVGLDFDYCIYATFKNQFDDKVPYSDVVNTSGIERVKLRAESPVGILADIGTMINYMSKGRFHYLTHFKRLETDYLKDMRELTIDRTIGRFFLNTYDTLPYDPKLFARYCVVDSKTKKKTCNDNHILYRKYKVDFEKEIVMNNLMQLLLNKDKTHTLMSYINEQYTDCSNSDKMHTVCLKDPLIIYEAFQYLLNRENRKKRINKTKRNES